MLFAVPAILALISSSFALPALNHTIVPRCVVSLSTLIILLTHLHSACGTFISDDDLIAAEAHFAANKVAAHLVPLAVTLKVLTVAYHPLKIN
jgi:hypothetical protein